MYSPAFSLHDDPENQETLCGRRSGALGASAIVSEPSICPFRKKSRLKARRPGRKRRKAAFPTHALGLPVGRQQRRGPFRDLCALKKTRTRNERLSRSCICHHRTAVQSRSTTPYPLPNVCTERTSQCLRIVRTSIESCLRCSSFILWSLTSFLCDPLAVPT